MADSWTADYDGSTHLVVTTRSSLLFIPGGFRMKIGELARAARCSTETVRFYEKAGLLPEPARSGGNYRQYGPAHLERLRFIRNCRGLDMAHDEIRALLGMIDHPARDCGAINH